MPLRIMNSPTPTPTLHSVSAATPVVPRSRRNLDLAIYLRPRDVFALYGIPTSTLSILCNHPDKARRIPSTKIPGRRGKKGLRLINRNALDAYLLNQAA